MKFDVIIGNPPYQRGKESNFYVKFIDIAAERLNHGGMLSLIIPNRFILPHHPAAVSLKKNLKLLEVYVDVNQFFPKVGTKVGRIRAINILFLPWWLSYVKVHLKDDSIIPHCMDIPIPSKLPTKEGIELFHQLKSKKHFTFVNKQPTHNSYVFVSRQWKSSNGRIYFDAIVNGSGDGKYIETDKPEEVCDYLRNSNVAQEIHHLFGDQMNIWPFLWDLIPTQDNDEK